MESKYRAIMETLLYKISEDIYSLVDVDYGDIIEAITNLSDKVEKLSDDMWNDKVSYNHIVLNLD